VPAADSTRLSRGHTKRVLAPIDDLRQFAVARSLFSPTTLERALDTFGFVQADPIRAPARAQDLTLRHRVKGYRAGDLERRYGMLGVEEDVFINYGFVTRAVHALMHPRTGATEWPASKRRRVDAVLAFVRAHGTVHPRQVDSHFAHGTVRNYWGGSSNATTHLLDLMHYRGLLRVVGRQAGIRIYAASESVPQRSSDWADRATRVDALIDVAVRKYAPLPGPSLSYIVSRLRYAVPHWRGELKPALERARLRLSHTRADGIEWYWPVEESVGTSELLASVRLLAPFDPLVWDRRRFELFWGWAYRFEAYTPVARRKHGYYALPLLWRDQVVGWGNISVTGGELDADIGYVTGRRPRERSFTRELDAELERVATFLRVKSRAGSE
jgi:uncharacterized protein YcaQ